jgi:hypothetical protein
MKTINILFALLVLFTLSFIGCKKDNVQPQSANVTFTAYGENYVQNSYHITSQIDSLGFDIWIKEMNDTGTPITFELPNVLTPDTIEIGAYGNRLIVYINNEQYLDTSFVSYILLSIPLPQ